MQEPCIQSFFDPETFTVTHVVSDPVTRRAAIIDSVLDYDPKSGHTSHASADRVIEYMRQAGNRSTPACGAGQCARRATAIA